jgi:hypothetical protein
MIIFYEMERMGVEAVISYFKFTSLHLSGGTKGNYEKPQLR